MIGHKDVDIFNGDDDDDDDDDNSENWHHSRQVWRLESDQSVELSLISISVMTVMMMMTIMTK